MMMEADAGLSNGAVQQRSFPNLANLRQERGLLTMIFVLSIVEAWAAVVEDPCNEFTRDDCIPEAVTWAFLAGVVSALLCALLLYLISLKPNTYVLLAEGAGLLLFLWWVAAAYMNNFLTPFEGMGNGFFASWGALLSATLFCSSRLDGLDSLRLRQQPTTRLMGRSHPGTVQPVTTSQHPPSAAHPAATTVSSPPAPSSVASPGSQTPTPPNLMDVMSEDE